MNKKILALLGEDKFLRVVIENKLSSAGYHVEFTIDCDNCLEQINKICPQLLLIDIMLHGENGIKIIEEVRNGELDQRPKIIAFYEEDGEYMEKLREFEVSEYLLRNSFTLDELLEKVNKILAS